MESEPVSPYEMPGNCYEVTEAVIWRFGKKIFSRFYTKLREVSLTEANLAETLPALLSINRHHPSVLQLSHPLPFSPNENIP